MIASKFHGGYVVIYRGLILGLVVFGAPSLAMASIPSSANMQEKINTAMAAHANNTENPHNVTKEQVGLGNVPNIDVSNASNLTSGTVDVARLPVGTTTGTVASGGDTRFDTLPTTTPTGTPPAGRVYVWFN